MYRAVRLHGAATQFRVLIGVPSRSTEPEPAAATIGLRMLNGPEYHAALEAGKLITISAAVQDMLDGLAIRPQRTPRRPAGEELLTPRESEVAALLAAGLSNRAIAERLVISEGTAEVHVKRILSKLGGGSRAKAAVWAAQRLPARG